MKGGEKMMGFFGKKKVQPQENKETKEVSKKDAVKYPRVIVSGRTHAKITSIAKKEKRSMRSVSNEVIIAGLKALGYAK